VNTIPTIAIIGAGASGTLLAVQLAAQSTHPLHIALFDASGAFARGVAYGTHDPSHLLNVTANRMGAFEDRSDDFYRWLLAHEAQWRSLHAAFAALKVTPTSFMPRMIYGTYLESLLQAAQTNKQARIERVKAEVTDAEATSQSIILTLVDGAKREADRLALAIGNLPAHPFGFTKTLSHSDRYIGHIWSPPQNSVLSRTDFRDDDTPVFIIGTGLTTIDAVVSLRAKGYKGRIIAVSRHGLLPQPHMLPIASYPRFLPPEHAPRTALELIRAIREEVTRAQKEGTDWRSVIDTLRADTPALWRQLSEEERRKLLRVLSYWSTHRHRMPQESAAMIAGEVNTGTLEIIAGSIRHIEESEARLIVQVRLRESGEVRSIEAGHVLNCSGPDTNIARSANALLLNLYKQGIIEQGPLAMGIAVSDDYSVKGNAAGRVFALGPLLAGERLETIAMPEIRAQAANAAHTLLSSL